jgi:hypothetical protein
VNENYAKGKNRIENLKRDKKRKAKVQEIKIYRRNIIDKKTNKNKNGGRNTENKGNNYDKNKLKKSKENM